MDEDPPSYDKYFLVFIGLIFVGTMIVIIAINT